MASASQLSAWTNILDNSLTAYDVRNTLKPIQDDLWVATACMDRLVDDVAVQRVLLEIGIERTENAAERSNEAFLLPCSPRKDEGGEEAEPQKQTRSLVAHFRTVPVDAQLCQIRAVLLERLDRLNTFAEICKEAPEKSYEEGEVSGGEEWEDDPWAVEGEPLTPETKVANLEPPILLSSFMVDDLLRSACLLASQQWFAAVQILFERHGSYLRQFRFVILDSIPAHATSPQYRGILPDFDISSNSELILPLMDWRAEPDWTETPQVRAAIHASGTTTLAVYTSLTRENDIPLHPEPLNAVDLATWYKKRVDYIISSTGMIDIALVTMQHGVSQGLSDLDELGEEMSLLSRLVYDAPRPDQSDSDYEDWTLSRWNLMEPATVIRAYLMYSTPETIAEDISRLVMPYLFVLESRADRAGSPDPSLPTRLLYDFILSTPLDIAAAIFEASKPTSPVAQRLLRNDEDIARLALACLYGSNSLNEWPTMSRIFECLPAWDISKDDEGDEDILDTTISSLGAFVTPSTLRPRCTASDLLVFFKPLPLASLSRLLDILDVHLESGEILSRWSVPAPLRWFLQSNQAAAEQRSWANRMARRAGGSKDQLDTQEDWEWLLGDMLKLSGTGETGLRGAFGLLSGHEVVRIFLSGLLSTGKFAVANNILHSPKWKHKLALDPDTIEDICLSSSREFYDNASSGNYKFGDMKLAYECLDIPPFSTRLLKEKDFIEATSRLASFNVMSRPGIPISPIEIRLTKDRLSLVSRVLSSNADAYKHTEVILDLVYKLGFRDDIVAKVKTLAMLADTAIQAEDFLRAFESNERMVHTVSKMRTTAPLGLDQPKMQEASEVCWVACFQLGRQPEFNNVQKRLCLLGRALELCPADKLHDILTAWRRLGKDDIEAREERLASRHGLVVPGKHTANTAGQTGSSLTLRLRDFRLSASPLANAPELASRTFNRVAATFPFSVGGRGRDAAHSDERSRSGSRRRGEGRDIANRVFQKGIGWLIGAEDGQEV